MILPADCTVGQLREVLFGLPAEAPILLVSSEGNGSLHEAYLSHVRELRAIEIGEPLPGLQGGDYYHEGADDAPNAVVLL